MKVSTLDNYLLSIDFLAQSNTSIEQPNEKQTENEQKTKQKKTKWKAKQTIRSRNSVGGKSIEKLSNKCVRKFRFFFNQKLTNWFFWLYSSEATNGSDVKKIGFSKRIECETNSIKWNFVRTMNILKCLTVPLIVMSWSTPSDIIKSGILIRRQCVSRSVMSRWERKSAVSG